jgi:hypothetical protein
MADKPFPTNTDDLKQANSGLYSTDPQGNVTTHYDSLSFATAGVY